MYQSFKKIIEFCYLDDLNVLNGITDSTEMIEIIKLSSHYKLNRLLKAAESYFQDHMVSWLDSSSTCLTLKLQSDNNSKEKKKNSHSSGSEGNQIQSANKDANTSNNTNSRGQ